MGPDRRFVLLGVLVAGTGLLCLGSGVALLAWRMLQPDQAVLLPPGAVSTPENTPTPGHWGRPVLPPPEPVDPAQVVILPESDLPTPPAAPATRSPVPTLTPTPALPTPVPPDRILISAIDLDAPVVSVGQHPLHLGDRTYSQWDVPDTFAAGWHQSSAPPGQIGNTVINGHHNISGEVFRYLVRLKPGNVITLESGGQRFYYVVAQTMTLAEEGQPVSVRQENARWILPTHDERVTLITCWPYSGNSHRLVVVALPAVPADIP